MIDYCPNCGGKDVEKLSDTEIYCKPCDQTFRVTKGKTEIQKKGRITDLEDRVKTIEEGQQKLKDKVEEYF